MAEGHIPIEQFLQENKLSDTIALFKKREIEINELVEIGFDELRKLAQSLGLDLLSENRLVKAIKKLKPLDPPHSHSRSRSRSRSREGRKHDHSRYDSNNGDRYKRYNHGNRYNHRKRYDNGYDNRYDNGYDNVYDNGYDN
eukprot:524337_1